MMNENENLNAESSGTTETPADYSFDFSNQVNDVTTEPPVAAPEAPVTPQVEEPVVQEQPASEVSLDSPTVTEAPAVSPEATVLPQEPPVQTEVLQTNQEPQPSEPVTSTLSEPEPQVVDAVQQADSLTQQVSTPEVTQGIVQNDTAAQPETLVAEPSVQEPNETQEVSAEAAKDEQKGDKNVLKSGKILVFFIILVAIVAAVIFILPQLTNIGG